jgi:hypothetical protein
MEDSESFVTLVNSALDQSRTRAGHIPIDPEKAPATAYWP